MDSEYDAMAGVDGEDDQLSVVSAPQRATAPVNGASDVAEKGRQRRVLSPSRAVRNRVREMILSLGYEPTPGDIHALTRWAHLFEVWRRMAARLDRDGFLRQDGDPKKLLAEWRALSAELSRLEAALGITAAARAALGVDVARMRDLAGAMADRGAG